MAWKKRPAQTEISSPQWRIRVARKEWECTSPTSRDGVVHGEHHLIAVGSPFAYNSYYEAAYCIRCFEGWAPAATVRKLGYIPTIDTMFAKLGMDPDWANK